MLQDLLGLAALEGLSTYLDKNISASLGQRVSSECERNNERNAEAFNAFLAEVLSSKCDAVLMESGDIVPLTRAHFRPKSGDPDIGGDEGVFGFWPWTVSLDGIRIRKYDESSIEMADRWGDSIVFGLQKNQR